jgi:hypothetical protein
MSQTVTISDDLFSRLEAAARRRGLNSVVQLLESWQGSDEHLTRFEGLVQRWKRETAHISNVGKKALHPAYQEIIGMGMAALPLLLAELNREPDDWFWALNAITGASPVPAESRGNVHQMADAWIQWGVSQGYQV